MSRLTKDWTAKMLLDAAEAAEAKRRDDMPDDAAAIRVMMGAWLRLQDLGWREAMYCPKDGSWFDSISAGSTGIHPCQYVGEWPTGSYWVADGGDLWPAQPILWRRPKDTTNASK